MCALHFLKNKAIHTLQSREMWLTTSLFLLIFALLSGCADKFIANEDDLPHDPSQPIVFTTHLGMVLRGVPVNDAAGMTSIGVFCAATGASDWDAMATPNKMFDHQLNNQSGVWTYQEDEKIFWDANSLTDRYTFFAYAPHTQAGNGITVNGSASTPGIPSLKYTVPTDVSMQPDLMVAVPRYDVRPVGNVSLRMKHALTCVGFQIAGDGEQIKGISISGVAVSGNVIADGENIVWSNLAPPTTTDFSTSLNYDSGQDYYTVPENMSTNLIASDGYLMMIPQALGSDAKIIITFSDDTIREISLDTYTWEAGSRVTYHITLTADGTITVSPGNVVLPYSVTNPAAKLSVICQKENGDPDPNTAWTLTVAESSWCRLSLTSGTAFGSATASVSGKGSGTVYLIAANNTGSSPRETTIYLGASSSDIVTAVTQWGNFGTITDNEGGGTPPVGAHTYVGAFWRANQTGERLIRIDAGANAINHGAWTASVMWLDPRWGASDGVVLSTDHLDDVSLAARGISFSSIMNPDTYGTPEDYPVTGYITTVNGNVNATNRNIFFRIGLKSNYTPTEQYPVRYAVVLISYANNTRHQKIFLRQGEEADYLMTNSDPVSTGGLSSRTVCRKFSPYNLTANDLDRELAKRGGRFTNYPSQAGAFFQWNNVGIYGTNRTRWAWNPYTPASQETWNRFVSITYWNTLADEHETSPVGYRRPNDGSISGNEPSTNISNSELRQSLFLKPLAGANYAVDITNSLWGYYADGFFDRRQIVNGNNAEAPNTTVASGTRDIAYIGRLFFNPISGSDHFQASLFFPAPGMRYYSTGNLSSTGYETQYWTASAVDQDIALGLRIWNEHASPWKVEKDTGALIRCVKD